MARTIIEPFRIKSVEPIRWTTRQEREQLLKAAYYDIVHNESKIQNYYATDLLKNVQ